MVREAAAFALGKIKDSRAVEPLIKALKDKFKDVREKAIFALAAIASQQTIDPRCREIFIDSLKDENRTIRSHVARGLGYMEKDDRSVKALKDALKDDDLKVRREAKRDLRISVSPKFFDMSDGFPIF